MKVLVFDFDKTLTYKDSFTQLCCQRMLHMTRWWVFPVYITLKILSKFRLISVKREKEIAIYILFPHRISEYNKICQEFSSRIKLNPIVNRLNKAIDPRNRIIILSASPREYIQPLFPEIEIYATELKVDHTGKIKGIDRHPYGPAKSEVLVAQGVTHIDEMYYDSHSDEVLIPLCDVWHKVAAGKIIGTYSKL